MRLYGKLVFVFLFSAFFSYGAISSINAQAPTQGSGFRVTSSNNILSTAATPQLATLEISFVLEHAIANGSIEILIRAANTNNNDGIADILAFDYGGFAAGELPVICPTNVGNITFGVGRSYPGAITIDGNTYHRIICSYTGINEMGADFDINPITVGTPNMSLINPRPTATHISLLDEINWGEAPMVIVRHLDSNNNVILSRDIIPTLNISFTHTTALVSDELSFRISGINAGEIACGRSLTDSSTPTSVIFAGALPGAFSTAAQRLEIVSTARGGYAISVYQSDQMSLDGIFACNGPNGLNSDGSAIPECIQDVMVNSMSPTLTAAWTNPMDFGLAYTLQRNSGSSATSLAVFNYNQGFRQLADAQSGEFAVPVMRNHTTTNLDSFNICFQLSPNFLNPVGSYENSVHYIVTATF
ncbi:MAG: hypothetical protein LBG64_04020 [Pseudomonadales bacterium]|jgi:hypothetical protein|nr:hypothetical protein [Pseudomonadales bacterium]